MNNKKTIFLNFILLFAVLSSAPNLSAQTPGEIYTEGNHYFLGQNGVRQDQLKGVQLIEQAAGQGSLEAQKFLGDLYLWGDYAPAFAIDLDKAIEYLKMAADQGDAQSMAFLGNAYSKKPGGNTQNQFDSFRWYLKAAEAGYDRAAIHVGEGYFYGTGAPMDKTKAAKWLRKSAELGNDAGQYLLGHMLRDGIGIEKNISEAIVWLEKSVAQGNHNAKLQLGLIYYSGTDGVDKNMIKALALLSQSADAGNVTAQTLLGSFFLVDGPTQNLAESFKWYQMAAVQGNSEGLKNSAKFYLSGDVVAKSPEKAVALLEQAVVNGDIEAQTILATLRRDGIGTEKDEAKSATEMLVAAHRGDRLAQYGLGLSYRFGDGQEMNLGQAFLWFEKSADQGLDLAQKAAGEMLYEGRGIAQDKARGIAYYQKAASQGEPQAIEFLKSLGLDILQYEDSVPKNTSENSVLNVDTWGSL